MDAKEKISFDANFKTGFHVRRTEITPDGEKKITRSGSLAATLGAENSLLFPMKYTKTEVMDPFLADVDQCVAINEEPSRIIACKIRNIGYLAFCE